MASSTNYKLLLQAQIDPKTITAQIESLKNKQTLVFKTKLDESGMRQFNQVMDGITEKAKEIGKVSFSRDQFGNLTKGVIQYTDKAGNAVRATVSLGKELKVNEVITNKAARSYSFMESQLGKAIQTTINYATSVGLVYGALKQLQDGVQYLKDLNKELTNIQLLQAEGAKTDEQISGLSLRYNELAKSLGATTLEVAKGSTEWLRQGKTIDETSKLLESSMMLSKLGNIESAQSTEYLTSILNGFKLEAEDAQDVISKLINLDNNFATSTAEIAAAMQRSSVSAQQAGVSMEELASMITVVSDVSRRAPESIGKINLPKYTVMYKLIILTKRRLYRLISLWDKTEERLNKIRIRNDYRVFLAT